MFTLICRPAEVHLITKSPGVSLYRTQNCEMPGREKDHNKSRIIEEESQVSKTIQERVNRSKQETTHSSWVRRAQQMTSLLILAVIKRSELQCDFAIRNMQLDTMVSIHIFSIRNMQLDKMVSIHIFAIRNMQLDTMVSIHIFCLWRPNAYIQRGVVVFCLQQTSIHSHPFVRPMHQEIGKARDGIEAKSPVQRDGTILG